MRRKLGRAVGRITVTSGLLYFFWSYGFRTLQDSEQIRNKLDAGKVYDSQELARNKTLVILYSNQRSGSSFLGEIFNRNPGAFYLYEPLLPFTTRCEILKKQRVDLLTKISYCDYRKLSSYYREVLRITNYQDEGCVENNICFADRLAPLINKYKRMCEQQNAISSTHDRRNCTDSPFRYDILERLCKASRLIAFKVLRICSLRMLETFYTDLVKRGYNIYLIHLFRDPRAILASRVNSNLDGIESRDFNNSANELCLRFERNLEYMQGNDKGSFMFATYTENVHYMKIRYEDVVMNVSGHVKSIYKFIGMKVPSAVEEWISQSHVDLDAMIRKTIEKVNRIVKSNRMEGGFEEFNKMLSKIKDPYGIVRDEKKVLKKWRSQLGITEVKAIQEICAKPMRMLGYKLFNSSDELANQSLSFF